MDQAVIWTTLFDYLWMAMTLIIYNNFVNDNLTSFKASTLVLVFIGEYIREILQMFIFFRKQVIDEARNYRPDIDLIISIIRLKISFGIASAIAAYYGYFVWTGLELKVLFSIYTEFIVMILTKDLQLEVFHHWMHHGSKWFKCLDKWIRGTHYFHHRTKLDLNSISAFYTSMEDAVMENLAAPFAVIGIKWFLGLSPTINIGTFMMYIVYDIHCHSANPYSIVFFNPILDYLMKANVAHHNHHMNPKMNHRAIPLKHLFSRNSIIKDIEIYTKMRKITMTIDNFY